MGEWRAIPGYEGFYEASSEGAIRNVKRDRLLKPYGDGRKGYLVVRLHKNGRANARAFKVHRLVAMAFIPNPNNHPQVNHLDFDKLNNCVSNLEWCSCRENIMHAVEAGIQTALRSPTKASKLSTEQVVALRAEYQHGAKVRDLAVRYGITRSTASAIAIGKARKSAPGCNGIRDRIPTSAERKAQVVARYREGAAIRVIQREERVARDSLYQWIREAGCPLRVPQRTLSTPERAAPGSEDGGK